MEKDLGKGTSNSVKLYKMRWIFLAVITLLYFTYMYSGFSVSQINNIFVQYFHVTYAAVDWATIGSYPTTVITTFVLVWLVYKECAKFRYLSVAMTSFVIASHVARMVAFANSHLFAFIVVGQIFNGVCAALSYPLCLSLVMAWFPHEEVGTAVGLYMSGGSLGQVVGTLLPSHLVIQPTINGKENGTSWKVADRDVCLIMWGVPLVIVFVVLAFILSMASDHPPMPPTLVQNEARRKDTSNLTFRDFLNTCFELMKNRTYIVGCIAGSMISNSCMIEITMMPQLMKNVLHNSHSEFDPDIISSYAIMSLSLGEFVGAIIGGRLVDKFRCHKRLLLITSMSAVVCVASITIAYHWSSYQATIAINAFFGFFSRCYLVSLIEILTQLSYPLEATFATAILRGFICFITVAEVEIGRLIFDNAGGVWVLIFQTTFIFSGMLFTLLIKVENKRLDAEERLVDKVKNTITETTRLMDEF